MPLPLEMPFSAPVILAVSAACPACNTMKTVFLQLAEIGEIGTLSVKNLAVDKDWADERGIQSVPWFCIGDFEFDGLMPRSSVLNWVAKTGSDSGRKDYMEYLLDQNEFYRALALVKRKPDFLKACISLMEETNLDMKIRIGISALMEELKGSRTLTSLCPELAQLARHKDKRIRADACFYLGLTGTKEAKEHLQTMLNDKDKEVREIVEEALSQA